MVELASSHEPGRVGASVCHPDPATSQKKTSALTLDMAVRLLRTALPQPKLTEAEAIAILKYHLQRNKTAQASHRKTWLERHKDVKFKLLL